MVTVYLLGVTCPRTTTVLESLGYKIRAVASSDELIDCIKYSPSPPGVIAEIDKWDWQVLDLVGAIIQLHPDAKVVLTTLKAPLTQVVFAIKAGAVNVLQKSIETWTLANIIKESFESLRAYPDSQHIGNSENSMISRVPASK